LRVFITVVPLAQGEDPYLCTPVIAPPQPGTNVLHEWGVVSAF
jgi:hypothetical protein